MIPLTRRHLLVGGAALAGGTALGAPPAGAAPKGRPPQLSAVSPVRSSVMATRDCQVSLAHRRTRLREMGWRIKPLIGMERFSAGPVD